MNNLLYNPYLWKKISHVAFLSLICWFAFGPYFEWSIIIKTCLLLSCHVFFNSFIFLFYQEEGLREGETGTNTFHRRCLNKEILYHLCCVHKFTLKCLLTQKFCNATWICTQISSFYRPSKFITLAFFADFLANLSHSRTVDLLSMHDLCSCIKVPHSQWNMDKDKELR